MSFLRKLHKWLGLIVGVQLLLWTVSGFTFAWLNHHDVMAEHSTREIRPLTLSPATRITEPSKWQGEYAAGPIYEIRLIALLDQWLWRIELADRVELRSAEHGERLRIDEPLVRRLALAHYMRDGELTSITYHDTSSPEARKAGAVWQARFNDDQDSALYFAADDGHLVASRNSTWRLFDFFWMLHTMDYRGRDNFNNPLVITAATAALWLSLSGILLLTRSFRRRDFDFLRGR
jgi:hypothetical protein